MTKENKPPHYYWHYEYDVDGLRYALCPEGSFVVSRDDVDEMFIKPNRNQSDYNQGYEDGYNQAINDILKLGEK